MTANETDHLCDQMDWPTQTPEDLGESTVWINGIEFINQTLVSIEVRTYFIKFNPPISHAHLCLQITPLRKNVTYVRVYTSLITSVVMVLIPTYVLAFSTKKVYDKLNTSVETNHALSDERKQARLKRNQSITRILIGIIILFLLCHTGKVRVLLVIFQHRGIGLGFFRTIANMNQ